MKQMSYVESITEDYKDWSKDALNHKIMSDFLNANDILFTDLFSSECKHEGDIIVGDYRIDLSKQVLFKKNYIRRVNVESGLENICKFLINYNNIFKPVTYENIIEGMGLNLMSIAVIEDKKGLKIQDSLSKKHFEEMKQLQVINHIKRKIGLIINEYCSFRKVTSNCYYSEVTKYELDYDNYVEFSVNRDYLSLMVIQNDECICHQLHHRLDVIKDEHKVYDLILKELPEDLSDTLAARYFNR